MARIEISDTDFITNLDVRILELQMSLLGQIKNFDHRTTVSLRNTKTEGGSAKAMGNILLHGQQTIDSCG